MNPLLPLGPALTAVSLFTVLPVPGPSHRDLDPAAAAQALRWLPAIGALLGAAAAVVLLLVGHATPGAAGRVLGALVAVGLLAVLTGGMHLDGLADTADGIASRRSVGDTLTVMERSDVGPSGAAALFFTVAFQVVAVAAIPDTTVAAGALVLAAVTARTAVLTATGPGVPSARPGGFGGMVTGSTQPRVQLLLVGSVTCAVAVAATDFGGPVLALRLVGAHALGLIVADQVRRGAQRRISGVTGDVFGAMIEVAAAAVLVAVALTS